MAEPAVTLNDIRAPSLDQTDAFRVTALRELEKKVLWLSTWMIHHANFVRPNRDGMKIGGHQASSASVATLMTALYFDVLRPADRVAVKPHASPVFHAIQYLLGRQTRDKLERFRALGGAQSYPSRTKDIDDVDFSTGSVGLGAAMSLFASLAQDYVRAKGLCPSDRQLGRMIALVGDAELDEGNVHEALLEAWKHDVRNVWWVIDYNRQSLDSVISDRLFDKIEAMFRNVGWRVVTLKYGRELEATFRRPGGPALRAWIDACPNALYSALVFKGGAAWRERLAHDLAGVAGVETLLAERDDASLARLMTNLAGHDLPTVLDAFHGLTDDRPTCLIAYTIKGYGLPIAGHKDNHPGLMTEEQIERFRTDNGIIPGAEWDRFAGLDVPAADLERFLVYCTRFFGHKAALCGLVGCDCCGHPVPPCFGRASVAVLFQQPVLIVAIEVGPDGGADLLDVLEDASENDLLLQRADESLGDAVGLGLADEGEAGRHPEELQLVLEVLGHEGTAVVVAQRHPSRGIGADGAEDLADGERQRRGGGVAIALFGDVPAETLGVPVFGDDKQRDVAVLDCRDDGAVGAPNDVRRLGGNRAVVVVRRTGWAALRREQAVLAHDPQHAASADADAVDHPQPRPDLAVPLAGPRRARQVVANGGEQVLVAGPRFRTASAGRALLWPSLLAPGIVERRSRDAPDRADPLHAIRLAGRRRGRGGHQRDLLCAKGPGFSNRARNSSFSMLNAPMRRCASASARSCGSSSRSRSAASIPASPRCRHSSSL